MKKTILYLLFIAFCWLTVVLNGCGNDTSSGPNYDGKYLCISLNKYITELSKLVSSHSKIPDSLETMYGLSWIDGYIVDTTNRDIIIIGKRKKGRPVYHSEDLFVNYQNVFDSVAAPYCSLDPYPENNLRLNQYLSQQTNDYETLVKNCQEAIGGQKVVISGVPLNSRIAKIMIYADYQMKKLSQGLTKSPGIRSAIDISAADTSISTGAKSSASRYWLHIKENANGQVYPNYNENDGIVFINECPVVVLTEKQYTDKQGNLKDDSLEKDSTAIVFASEMSEHYTSLAANDDLFAELENMFRLQACLQAMKFKNAIQNSGIDLSAMEGLKLVKGNELPVSLPGLVNYKLVKRVEKGNSREIGLNYYIVAGGVSQEMKIGIENLIEDKEDLLIDLSSDILNSKPNNNPIFWLTDIKNQRDFAVRYPLSNKRKKILKPS